MRAVARPVVPAAVPAVVKVAPAEIREVRRANRLASPKGGRGRGQAGLPRYERVAEETELWAGAWLTAAWDELEVINGSCDSSLRCLASTYSFIDTFQVITPRAYVFVETNMRCGFLVRVLLLTVNSSRKVLSRMTSDLERG